MINLTLRQLRYFEALARHGHFGRAAEACAISQPALSVQIRGMEETLGTALFERSTRKVRLTGFGEEVAQTVREILLSMDRLTDLSRRSREGFVGRLRLGVIPTIAPYLLPRLIESLGANHSGLDIRIRETLTQTLLSELINGQLDAAIVALPISEASLVEMPLFTEEFVLIRPLSDGDKTVPDVESLREMKLLLLEEGHCFRDQALAFCGSGPSAPRELLDASSLATLVQLVAAGIGITLIPEMAVPVETTGAKVSVSAFSDPCPTRTVGLIWRQTNPLSDRLREIGLEVQKVATTDQNAK